ncbi:ABC transporter ATP-binding protein [Lactiplantibacillus sp. DA1]|uniref:ABC transporter ATP-binding protein n=1 Tax=Lactiplantibacillus sp. DA1 TaxID=3079857 RepID=UPI00292A621B|nr:ABC transporter ATP-binding protein [Lactiplantibacillus sp. DA1]MDV0430275.1 ABC transporter ATP-binding protein [Lactiplantibacillus sp. DA1]
MQKKKDIKRLFRLILKHGRPNIYLFMFGIFVSILSTFLSLQIPYRIKSLVDQMPSVFDLERLAILLILTLFTSVVSVLTLSIIGARVVRNVRIEVWNRVVKAKYSDVIQDTGESVASHIINDSELTERLVSEEFPQTLTSVITAIGAGGMMFWINAKLAMTVFVLLFTLIVIILPFSRKMTGISKNIQYNKANGISTLSRLKLSNMLFKINNAQKYASNRGIRSINALYDSDIKQLKYQSLFTPLVNVILLLMVFAVIVVGKIEIQNHLLSAGGLTAFFLYLSQEIAPFLQISKLAPSLARTVGGSEQLYKYLSYDEEEQNNKRLSEPIKNIKFEDVCFSYPYNKKIVFDHLSFEINSPLYISIIGQNGGGKSTILKMLEKLYKPDSGSIYINGNKLNDLNISSVRDNIIYITQHPLFFSGSIMENLTIGQRINESKVWNALSKVNLEQIVRQLPLKLETSIEEMSNAFSGGELQRLAIARLFLQSKNVIFLDEVLSHLDPENRITIKRNIFQFAKSNRCLVIDITHDQKHLKSSDLVLNLDNLKQS